MWVRVLFWCLSLKILLLEKIHHDALSVLERVGEVRLIESLESERVIAECGSAVAVLTRGRGRVPEEAIAAGGTLMCVARCGVGTDNIDVAAATQRGILILYNPDSMTSTVAEHVMMLALAVARRVSYLDRAVKENDWGIRETLPLGIELRGKVLGIFGLGRIGCRVAELGHAFGMEVLYWSLHNRDSRFQHVEKEELFRRSDFLSINVPLTPETRGLVDAQALGWMKPTAILINTTRGEVIDERALIDSLERGLIGGAGLDVVSSEAPPKDHPLFKFDSVVITPHVGGITDRAFRKTCIEVAQQVARVLEGNLPDPHFVRNPEILREARRPS